jgi:hypothetical protein
MLNDVKHFGVGDAPVMGAEMLRLWAQHDTEAS